MKHNRADMIGAIAFNVTLLLNHYRFSGTAFATSDKLMSLTYADAGCSH